MKEKTFNAKGMKLQNKRNILECLRGNPYSRAELARQTGLTRAAISVIIDNLLEEGLVVEGEPILGKVGRKSYCIQLNPKKYFMIGITLERGLCTVGMIDFDGNIRKVVKLEYSQRMDAAEDILENIAKIIYDLNAGSSDCGELLGIGITAPSPLDFEKGQILNPPNFEIWENVYITDYFKQRFPVPIFLENDVNALASAERYYGIGRKYASYLELQLDTGVGGGLILNGELYKGKSGLGNQVGHTTIDIHGGKCICGNIGCGELYASIPKIIKQGMYNNPEFYSWKRIVNFAYNGDVDAKKLLQIEADYLSAIVVNVINILDLDAVILSGEITYRGKMLVEMIENMVNSRIMGHGVRTIPILLSPIPEGEKTLAACNLVMEFFMKVLL